MALLKGHQRRWIEEFFEYNCIPFVVIGGMAVKFYCPERDTIDVDLFVARDNARIDHLISALPSLAADPNTKAKLLDPRVGHFRVAGEYMIDVLTFAPALNFDAALQSAEDYKEEDVSLPILDRNLLIRHKQEVIRLGEGNEKDASDIRLLTRT